MGWQTERQQALVLSMVCLCTCYADRRCAMLTGWSAQSQVPLRVADVCGRIGHAQG